MGTFEEIRRSHGVKEDLYRIASGIATAAGDGYEVRMSEGKLRSRAAVLPISTRAHRDNAKHNTLFRVASRFGA